MILSFRSAVIPPDVDDDTPYAFPVPPDRDILHSTALFTVSKDPDTHSRNWLQKSMPLASKFDTARFPRQFFVPMQCTTSNGARRQSVTLERHETLATESGVEFVAPTCGAGFCIVC